MYFIFWWYIFPNKFAQFLVADNLKSSIYVKKHKYFYIKYIWLKDNEETTHKDELFKRKIILENKNYLLIMIYILIVLKP